MPWADPVLTPLMVGLLTFLLGLLVGHRLTLGRDKRKEYNEAAARILATFESYQRGRYIDLRNPGDMAIYANLLPGRKRERWKHALKAYEDAEADTVRDPTYSSPSVRDPELVTARLKDVIALISLR